jgi:pimeloyl-ACP methyl ester carboxylesterase
VEHPTTRRERTHRGIDAAIMWRLGAARYEPSLSPGHAPVRPEEFWSATSVARPAPVSVTGRWPRWDGEELRLEAPSQGPGGHPGASKLIATARINERAAGGAPMVLIVHGYAVPIPFWDAMQARRLRAAGAHTVLIDLPFHLRRRVPRRKSGDGYFGADPARIRATVRQSVEDAAALVAWARATVTPDVRVLGVSLGGLVASLLAAQVELEGAVIVAPFCDPPATFLERLPRNARRRLGLSRTSGGTWGADPAAARAMLDDALAPIVPRNLVPRTPPERITLVRPELDGIVGEAPIAELAARWDVELWDYPYGHITVMNAPGIGSRIRSRLLEDVAEPLVSATG